MNLSVVWFKRDLRISDHAPLYHACQQGPVIPIYVAEPELWRQPDTSLRQWQFIKETLLELDGQLSQLGQGLWFAEDSIENCLQALLDHHGPYQLFSHEEFGNLWTRQRNQRVSDWCERNQINWFQYHPDGTFDESEPAEEWRQYMAQAPLSAPKQLKAVAATPIRSELWPEVLGFDDTPCTCRQPGGRKAAVEELSVFLKSRGVRYHKEVSKPSASFGHSSRLSGYLSLGVLSLREVFRQGIRAEKFYASKEHQDWTASIQAFLRSLTLRSFFVKQFDLEPTMEQRALHKSFDGLREDEYNDNYLQAWVEARTGFPIIDAAMRSLRRNGWISFRLRGLLMSFASHHLWLHWREPALHLARFSVDYEPGVHYLLAQIMAGTTGLGRREVADLVALSKELDPNGDFIKSECSELAEVPIDYLHTPWLMPAGEQIIAECVLDEDYPMPVIDHQKQAQLARDKMQSWILERDDPAETKRVSEQFENLVKVIDEL